MKISVHITDKATVTPSRPNHKEGWVPKNWWFRTVMLENALESPFDYKEIKPVNTKEINPEYSLEGMMLKLRYSGQLMRRANLLKKPLMLGKVESKRRRGVAEDAMVGWHYQLHGHELEQNLGDSRGQGSLAFCSPWGHKDLVTRVTWTRLSDWTAIRTRPD